MKTHCSRDGLNRPITQSTATNSDVHYLPFLFLHKWNLATRGTTTSKISVTYLVNRLTHQHTESLLFYLPSEGNELDKNLIRRARGRDGGPRLFEPLVTERHPAAVQLLLTKKIQNTCSLWFGSRALDIFSGWVCRVVHENTSKWSGG